MASDVTINVRTQTGRSEQDIRSIKSGLQGIAGEAKRSILTGVGVGAGIGAFNLLSGAVQKVTEFVGDSIQAASNLAESTSKVGAVFGDSAGEIEDWADTAARAFGQSKQQALEAAGTYGNLFQAFGVGQEQAGKMSKRLVELAADLASFNNTSIDDAIQALRSGLSGETEPLKRFGVALSDARMRAELMAQGVTNLGATLTPLQKTQAAYSLILKDTTLAQGDFARTSDGLANSQRILAAEMENAKAELGEALLPVMLELTHFATDTLIPVLKDVIGVFKALLGPVGAVADAIGDFTRGVAMDFGDMAARVDELAEKTGRSVKELKSETQRYMDEFGYSFEQAADAVEVAMGDVEKNSAAGADAVRGEMRDLRADAKGEIAGMGADMAEGVKAGVQGMADEMLKGQFVFGDAITELTDFTAKALSPMQELMAAQGFLASKELAEALASNNPLIRQKAEEMRAEALAVINRLSADGYNAGYALIVSLAKAIRLNKWTAARAMQEAMQLVRNQLPGSEPKDPSSPLRGITKGFGMTETLSKAIREGAAPLRTAAQEAAGGLRLALPAPATASPVQPMSGIPAHSHPIYIDGQQVATALADPLGQRLRLQGVV